MANINLVPNPKVVGVLFIIFSINIYFIKALILEPFLKLKKNRDQLTVGSQETAKKLTQECEQMAASIKTSTALALEQAKIISEKILDDATLQQNEIIMAAQKDSQQSIAAMKAKLEMQFAAEKQNIANYSSKLTPLIFDVLTKA